MGHVEAAHLSHTCPTAACCSTTCRSGWATAPRPPSIGPNGAGKTTLLRLIAGDLAPQSGTVTRSGGLGVMRQFIGGVGDGPTVRDLLVSVSPPRIRAAAERLDAAERVMIERDDQPAQLRYAAALTDWGDAGGYEAEVLWDTCTMAALGIPYERCRQRETSTLSGGERKRMVLEALLRGPAEVLLLDEPDNYLDVPAKRWLEQQLAATSKTVLLVSHDRELLANCAERIVTVEDGSAWVHGGGFASYAQARSDRIARLDELRRRWDEEHEKLKALVRMYRQKASYNSDMASRLQAAVTRLREVRGGRAAGARAAGAGHQDAAARRAYRQARGDLRGPGADRPDEAVQPGDLVRRAGRRARLQRLRQVRAAPAARRRSRCRALGSAGGWAPGSSPGFSRRPTTGRTWPGAARLRS